MPSSADKKGAVFRASCLFGGGLMISSSNRRGFTLVEIMIVVFIVALLLAIAMPAFVNAREQGRTKTCVANLRQMNSAKSQYCLANRLSGTDVVPGGLPTLVGTGNYLATVPVCPSQGTYTLNDFNTDPICSVGVSGTGQFASTGPFYHGIK